MAESVSNQPHSAFAVFGEAFARAAGTPLVTGNEVRLLRAAGENYPAWLEAIAAARQTIHLAISSTTTRPGRSSPRR